jgi:hypothetical protein
MTPRPRCSLSLSVSWRRLVGGGVLLLWVGCGNDSPTTPESGSGSQALRFNNFQAASVVIGQADMNSGAPNAGGSTGPAGLQGPLAAGADTYYLPDTGNHRILGFDAVPTSNGASATFVLGQPDFTSNASGTTAQNFKFPGECAVSGGKLFLADNSNNRVLIWNSLPQGNVPADVVVGQTDFVTGTGNISASKLGNPSCIWTDGQRMVVADGDNNRILIWNTIPSTNGAAADVVVGQPDFVTSTSGLSASKLDIPVSVWSDGHRLVVADEDNSRVLIWNTIPATNGALADVVVGAPDFVTVGGSATATTFSAPSCVVSDGTSLFVADTDNNRVLIFTPFPTTNGAAASRVLGQSDFTHSAYNDDNQDGVADGNPSARGMHWPYDIRFSGHRMLVADSGNHRILVFQSK